MERQGGLALDKKKKRRLWHYFLQSLLAAVYIVAVLLLADIIQDKLVLASLGASAFIAFAFPQTDSSRTRFMLGGYTLASIFGCLCALLANWLFLIADWPMESYLIACALAMFLTMFSMTTLNLEHPPSCALAITLTISRNPFILALASLTGIGILCLFKSLIKRLLCNL